MSLYKLISLKDLSSFLNIGLGELTELKPDENYYVFKIPKPGSTEKRTIETPKGRLKSLLECLSDSLQWTYYHHKTDAAYGYVRIPDGDMDKRNIYTHAHKHLGNDYLVNVDFDNFFHQVDCHKVNELLHDYTIFAFSTETEELLTKLVTFKGRLPMGSPTSPPLSNFATIMLDKELLLWCKFQNITYTRYVDDLSFSSSNPISDYHFRQIEDIFHSHKFLIDPDKTKWYGKKDVKEITGLIVGEKRINIPPEFIRDFEKSLVKLKDVNLFLHHHPDHNVFEWVEKMKKVLRGRLSFIKSIYGRESKLFLKLKTQFEQIEYFGEIEESISWRYSGYEFH